MDASADYTDLLDITDILNADPQTFLSFSDENTTLRSYTTDQQHTTNAGANGTITESGSYQNFGSFYDNDSPMESSGFDHDHDTRANGNAAVVINNLDDLPESRELDEISQYLSDHPTFNKYDDGCINPATTSFPANSHSYKNIYTHLNNHISFTNEDLPFQASSTNSPTSPQPADASNIIDEQLLTEIDSLINKSALVDDFDSPNTPNTEQFFGKQQQQQQQQQQSLATPVLFQPMKLETPKNPASTPHHNQHQQHHHVVKKPSVKRLPPNVSQSPTTKRLAKSPSKVELFTGMAQTAAVLATSSSSSKSLASLHRHESARAAARAVGSTSNQASRNNNNSNVKVHAKSNSSGNTTAIARKRLVNARSNPNLSNLKAHSPTKTRDGSRHRVTQSVSQYTRSPSMNSIFDSDTLASDPSSFLESPLRISRLKSAKVKPSSCSIYSSATSTSVRTNLSNISNGSNTSKSSRGSGTFDQYSHLPGSSDTLETIVSMNTNESGSGDTDNHYHQFSISTKERTSSSTPYANLKYQPPIMHLQFQPQHPSLVPPLHPPIPPASAQQQNINFSQGTTRTSSTLSTKTDSSTTSPTGVLYTSTPSPIPGASNITFTPPNIINPNISNNYGSIHRAQSVTSSTEMEFVNTTTGSPLTPVTKTALKFEQLSTHSPQLSNGKFQNMFTMPENENAPRLSVWKTSPSAAEVKRERAKSVSLNAVAQSSSQKHKAYNTTKFTNNFIEEPISYRSNKPHVHVQTHNFDSHGHGTHTFSVAPSASASASASEPGNSNNVHRPANPNNLRNTGRIKTLTALNHASRNSMHSVHSSSSTNSTISNPSTQDDRDGRHEESKRSSVDSKNTRCQGGEPTAAVLAVAPAAAPAAKPAKHASKSSKDAAFKNLITTFNKKEPESYKPKVYSNMMQGLVEFQVKMGKSSSRAGRS